jgi:hypothetical protein
MQKDGHQAVPNQHCDVHQAFKHHGHKKLVVLLKLTMKARHGQVIIA